uniref:Defensin protein 1 n=1 Tax=Amblyomma hebraeum TaxID=34608 RepID=Q5VJF9_AMBHE|nr:defensin protein 1 [Amblyomma hebraeum]
MATVRNSRPEAAGEPSGVSSTEGDWRHIEKRDVSYQGEGNTRRFDNPFGCPADEGKCFDHCNNKAYDIGYCGGSYRATCVCYRK